MIDKREAQFWLEYCYPTTIIKDRYQGAYSGAKWLAFPVDYYQVPKIHDIAHCNNESCPAKDRCKRFYLHLLDCVCDMHYCTYLMLTEESKERAQRLGSCPHFLLRD